MNSIGFIGGGRITRIFLEGWERAGRRLSNIVVSDANLTALDSLKARYAGIEITTDNTLAARCDLVFLAVHPPVMAEVVAGIRDHLQPTARVVSLAPKFTIAKLQELLGGFDRLARVIPNAPSIIGAGYNPITFAAALDAMDRTHLMELLSSLGTSPEVVESKLEAYAILSAMGPTYLWFQLQTLRELATEFGLADAEIAPAMLQMVCGAARTLLESGRNPAEVNDLLPVRPLAAMESVVVDTYRSCLPAVYQKITPPLTS